MGSASFLLCGEAGSSTLRTPGEAGVSTWITDDLVACCASPQAGSIATSEDYR